MPQKNKKIPLKEVLTNLLDEENAFHPRYLYRLSDITPGEQKKLAAIWPDISLRRRQALMEDIESFGEEDYLLDFSGVGCLALRDTDAEVRMLAVRTLGNYQDTDLLPVFLKMSESDPDDEVRAVSASALGPFVYLGEIEDLAPEVLNIIVKHLLKLATQAESKLLRRRALEALGYSSHGEVSTLIEKAYASDDQEWLISALFAMGRSLDPKWNEQVLAMLEDERPPVRAEAAEAAGELGIKDAVDSLLDLLEDDDDNVRAAAIWALSEIGGEGIEEELEFMLENSEDDEEISLLEAALDNLEFTEGFESFAMLDLDEEWDKEAGNDEDFASDDEDYNEDDSRESGS